MDYRAVGALQMLENRHLLDGLPAPEGWKDNLSSYCIYLHVCRTIAERIGVSLRPLDRALWKWHKAKMPED